MLGLAIIYRSTMTRRELIRSLMAGLPAGSDCVSYPDHPLLLRGPDVLASYRDTLTAYFVVAQRSRKIASTVLPNVLLSRLALPWSTSFVLVLTESAGLSVEESWLFEEVVLIPKGGSLTVPIGRMANSVGGEVLEPLRIPHHERFAEAWAPATRGRRFIRSTPGEPTSLYAMADELTSLGDVEAPHSIGWRPDNMRDAQYMDFEQGKFFFSPPDSAAGNRLRALVSDATNVAVSADFGLDAGVGGLSAVSRLAQSGDAHLELHYSRIHIGSEVQGFDIIKPLRSAAFAGFESKLEQ